MRGAKKMWIESKYGKITEIPEEGLTIKGILKKYVILSGDKVYYKDDRTGKSELYFTIITRNLNEAGKIKNKVPSTLYTIIYNKIARTEVEFYFREYGTAKYYKTNRTELIKFNKDIPIFYSK